MRTGDYRPGLEEPTITQLNNWIRSKGHDPTEVYRAIVNPDGSGTIYRYATNEQGGRYLDEATREVAVLTPDLVQ